MTYTTHNINLIDQGHSGTLRPTYHTTHSEHTINSIYLCFSEF